MDGYVNQSGNDFGSGTNKISQTGSFTNPPYSFSLDGMPVRGEPRHRPAQVPEDRLSSPQRPPTAPLHRNPQDLIEGTSLMTTMSVRFIRLAVLVVLAFLASLLASVARIGPQPGRDGVQRLPVLLQFLLRPRR